MTVDGHCVETDKHCWHIFRPEYYGEDTSDPPEKLDINYEDNSVMVTPVSSLIR